MSYMFDTTGATISYPHIAGFDGTGAATISFWKYNSIAPAWGEFIKQSDGSNGFVCTQIGTDETDVDVAWRNAGNSSSNTGTGVVTTSAWEHWCIVFDGSLAQTDRVKLYLNNSLKTLAGSPAWPTTLGTCSSNFLMVGTEWWGFLAEIGLWAGKALSATKIAELAGGYKPDHIGDTPSYYIPLDTNGQADAVVGSLVGTATIATFNALHPTMEAGESPSGNVSYDMSGYAFELEGN